jgi:hypothetical protein
MGLTADFDFIAIVREAVDTHQVPQGIENFVHDCLDTGTIFGTPVYMNVRSEDFWPDPDRSRYQLGLTQAQIDDGGYYGWIRENPDIAFRDFS